MVLVPRGRSSSGLFEQSLVEVKTNRGHPHQGRRNSRKTSVPYELSHHGVPPVQVLDLQEGLSIGVPLLQRKRSPTRPTDNLFYRRPHSLDLGPRQRTSKSQVASALVLNNTAFINNNALGHAVPLCYAA